MDIDLRCGDQASVLGDVECDLLCTDTPYSARTHAAYSPRATVLASCARDARWAAKGGVRRQLGYTGWSAADVDAFVDAWSPRTRGWFVSITDDVLAPAWKAAFERNDRYAFAALPFFSPGSRVRLSGDGPSGWTTWIMVARPRTPEFSRWGTLPGGYSGPTERDMVVVGGKPLWLMRAIVSDYSKPGDLVCDPCAGGGTTLLAAALERRRAVGAEIDPETHAKALQRFTHGGRVSAAQTGFAL